MSNFNILGDRQCQAIVTRRGAQWQIQLKADGRFGPVSRTFRAHTLDDLLRVAISEVRRDHELGAVVGALCEEIRRAIFAAQDKEQA